MGHLVRQKSRTIDILVLLYYRAIKLVKVGVFMAKKKNKNMVVKESNTIARAHLSPPAENVWSERIISQVAAFNRVDDNEFPETVFMIGRLVDNRKKVSGSQFNAIQKAAEKLAGTTFTIFENKHKFNVYPVFEYIKYDAGIISAKLNKGLKPHYLELKKQFAIRSLPEFRTLSSVYSQQIFRLLNSWKSLPKKNVVIAVEELHKLAGAPDSLRANFKDFRARVLEPAQREINEKTALKWAWEPIKTGRKVTAIRFVFGELEAKKLEKNRHTAEKKTEKEILRELQTESIRCWEKHHANGKTCKPRKTAKRCEYCITRGKMSFSKQQKSNRP